MAITDLPAEERMHRILLAQADNLGRIVSERFVEGGSGSPAMPSRQLYGPTPDLIRLYDEPLRLVESAQLTGWERVVTISPVSVDPDARFVNRVDRKVVYVVAALIALTEKEKLADAQQIVDRSKAKRPDNPVSEKLARFLADFRSVFFENMLLSTADCPNGLVDNGDYSTRYHLDVPYPFAAATMTVRAQAANW